MSDDEASAIVVDDRRDSSKLLKDLDLDPEAPKTIFKMCYAKLPDLDGVTGRYKYFLNCITVCLHP